MFKNTRKRNFKNKKEEESLSLALTKYIRYKYPSLIFRVDASADVRLPPHLAKKVSALQGGIKKYPDRFIARAKKGYHGLYIELKKDREELYKKNGELRQTEHIQGQYKMLQRLEVEGYKAVFACGIDEAMQVIDEYLKD